ncbi:MAG: phenylalanine--tRNA ligase subunit alpha [Candidatus Marsarchaeota archaeon]|nr:phenylalanine--tRNA ligase subunit alpha [Candidatus Marsarchaeota archaeon]
MHEYEYKILSFIKGKRGVTLDDIESGTSIGKDSILWAIESLSKNGALKIEKTSSTTVQFKKEGESYLEHFPEESVVAKLNKTDGKSKTSDITDQIGLLWAKKNGWLVIEKGFAFLTDAGKDASRKGFAYDLRSVLNGLYKNKPNIPQEYNSKQQFVDILVKRNLISVEERRSISAIEATDEGLSMLAKYKPEKGIDILTREALKSRIWEKEGFRPYNINAPPEEAYPGRLHPMREFVNIVRQIWFEMGFVEVSGPIIESAFWNFDALFEPQDHPTRDMQDTFFLSQPNTFTIEDLEALEQVRKMHLTGWKEAWEERIAQGALMRTQVTALSARYMRKLALTVNQNYPLKLFSVGKVFRNESIDYKHLAEFNQYEGVIIGNNLTLANLIHTLKEFYGKLGFNNVRIRPSYFPFTEPSIEGYYYDEKLGENIELTGGGIIRREITKALGINKTVIAWGGGVERFLLDKLNVDSITIPFRNNVGWLRNRQGIKE